MEKHRCKVCRKSFRSGRSLGGHMRSHVAAQPEDRAHAQQSISSDSSPLGAAYGLRENPKRTWRYAWEVLDGFEHGCRDCGKCFPSSKALFGHMKCHSNRATKQDDDVGDEEEEEQEHERSLSGGARKMGLESSLSDIDASMMPVPIRRRRTPRRVMAVSGYAPVEEYVAVTLMMLSRDVRSWSRSGAESSDNNSIVSEDRDFTGGLGIGKAKMIVSYASDTEDDDDDESKMSFSKKRSVNYGLGGSEKKNGFDGSVPSMVKEARFNAYDRGFGGTEYAARIGFDPSEGLPMKAPEKRVRFECTDCNKTFHSYQALGGHRAGHKRYKGCPGSSTAGSSIKTEVSLDRAALVEVVVGPSKQYSRHECSICGKVFSSGQALGGHKRSHFVEGANDSGDTSFHQSIVINQQQVTMRDLLDLNLPAAIEEGSGIAKGSLELKPWWAAGSIKHEPLIGLISN